VRGFEKASVGNGVHSSPQLKCEIDAQMEDLIAYAAEQNFVSQFHQGRYMSGIGQKLCKQV